MHRFLPPELILSVISFLPITSIHALQLTSKHFDDLIRENQTKVYHGAAITHGLVLPSTGTDIEEIRNKEGLNRVLDGLSGDWMALCQRGVQLEKSWKGNDRSRLVKCPAGGKNVRCIKVDEANGFIITTSFHGPNRGLSLTVFDLREPDKVLWGLPATMYKCADIEYDKGYLIFKRDKDSIEVWRLATIGDAHPAAQPPFAQEHQLKAESLAAKTYAHTFPRGHFVPHAFLRAPGPKTGRFRFVYPSLAVSSSQDIHCYDVPSRQLVDTTLTTLRAPSSPHDDHIGDISDIDVSNQHIFICTDCWLLRVYDRSTGSCTFEIFGDMLAYGNHVVRILGLGEGAQPLTTFPTSGDKEGMARFETQFWSGVGIRDDLPGCVVARQQTEKAEIDREGPAIYDKFVAVRASSCGNHFAALLKSARIVVVRDFQRVVLPTESDEDSRRAYAEAQQAQSLQIDIGYYYGEPYCMAFEKGRVVVAVSKGVFIIDVNEFLNPQDPLTSLPRIVATRVPEFNSEERLRQVFSLAVSDTGIYVNWPERELRKEMWDSRARGKRIQRFNGRNPGTGGEMETDDVNFMAPDHAEDLAAPGRLNELIASDHSDFMLKEMTAFREAMDRSRGLKGYITEDGYFEMFQRTDYEGPRPPPPAGGSSVCGVDFAVWE
ncbi:hypothetical protein AAF712_007202 [Marasmius tenuissimus]|uniref:F-box domain-containing protein n=1 Tax=Marasmius tenuissimus TaxID=585030 RepID=A0ABR2ZX20_9AGAR